MAGIDTAQTPPVDSNQVTTDVVVRNPALTVVKSADETQVLTGETVQFHVTIQNTDMGACAYERVGGGI